VMLLSVLLFCGAPSRKESHIANDTNVRKGESKKVFMYCSLL
jgi:hypothetical protein